MSTNGAKLGVTREAAWEAWILYTLRAVRETSMWTLRKINSIRELVAHTSDFVRRKLPKIYSRELVETIFIQPYCRIQNLVDSGLAKRQTASVYLNALTELNILREQKYGRIVIPTFEVSGIADEGQDYPKKISWLS